MKKTVSLTERIPDSLAGQRLDSALASLFKQYSRSQLQNWIRAGEVKIDGVTCSLPRSKVSAHQEVEINASLEVKEKWLPQEISLNIIYEDEDIIIINKPAGLTVHPGAGNHEHTLVNALLHHTPELRYVPRAGLIHRLDKNTSGLLVIAKNLESHAALVDALQKREIKREYETIVHGEVIAGGDIDAPIGRHPSQRTRMAVNAQGKQALTHYRVIEKYVGHTRLRVQLETGRTHQIRVHLAHIGFPIVGDPVYTKRHTPGVSLKRQALHAAHLELMHPQKKQWMSWDAPLPEDLVELMQFLASRKK